MKSKKVLSLLITCAMTASMGTTVFASTEDQIAAAQAQKQEAQAGLDQTQANISGLESKKQELESYLSELNSQYNELTESISQLSTQAAEKEDELNKVKVALASAQKAAIKQKEAMSDRIQYIYEKGGTTMFEALISAGSLSELLNQANSISELSKYDRNMLEKYEATQKNIAEQQKKVEDESASINTMLAEKGSKQQEVQNLVATTSDNISSYVNQISANQEEAEVLMAQVSSADNDIAVLMEQAEQERVAEEAKLQHRQQLRKRQAKRSLIVKILPNPTKILPVMNLIQRTSLLMLPIQRIILIPKALMTAILMMKKQELLMMTVSTQTHLRIHLAMILLQRIPLIPAMILHLTAVHLILVHLTPVRELILETLSLQLTVTVQPVAEQQEMQQQVELCRWQDVL